MKRVSEYKYLGIWLVHKLKFKSHIDSVTNKLRQKLGFLYRNKTNFHAHAPSTMDTSFGKTAFGFSVAFTWNTLQQTLKLQTLVPVGQFKTMVHEYSVVECNGF